MSREYRVEDEYGRKIGTIRPQQTLDGPAIFVIIVCCIFLMVAPLVGPYIFVKGKLLNRWEEIGGWTKFWGFVTSLICCGAAIFLLFSIATANGVAEGVDNGLWIPLSIIALILEGISLFYMLSMWMKKSSQE